MLIIYEFTIPQLKRALANLSQNLSQGKTYAKAKNIEDGVKLNASLFADIYTYQASTNRDRHEQMSGRSPS